MDDSERPENNVQGLPWTIRACIEDRCKPAAGACWPPENATRSKVLNLSVLDGPDVWEYFDPDLPLDSEEEGGICAAIGRAATRMGRAVQEDEAFHWSERHEKVFLVEGFTGHLQSSDRLQDWVVAGFLNEDRAIELCDRLNAWCVARGLEPNGRSVGRIVDPEGEVVMCPIDPKFRVDGGTTYSVMDVLLDAYSPKVQDS